MDKQHFIVEVSWIDTEGSIYMDNLTVEATSEGEAEDIAETRAAYIHPDLYVKSASCLGALPA